MHYLLFYEKASGYAERQAPLVTIHLEHVENAARSGELVLAGSLNDPDDGAAILLFHTDSREFVEKFAATDPYVTGGIISRWWIRTWDVVAGSGCS